MKDTSDTEGRMVSMASERRPQVRMRTLPQELPHSSQRRLNFAVNQRMKASCFRLRISEVGLKVMGQFAPKKLDTVESVWKGGRREASLRLVLAEPWPRSRKQNQTLLL